MPKLTLILEQPLPAGRYDAVLPDLIQPPPAPPAPTPTRAYPAGKGYYVWNLRRSANGHAGRLVEMALLANLTWVAIKVHDGPRGFNGDLQPWVQPLRNAYLDVWGWGYCYGDDPVGEARVAVERCRAFGVRGYLCDVEHEYKVPGRVAQAERFVEELHRLAPDLPFGLCSYRYPSLHPQLPWPVLLRYATFHNPQVYWIGAQLPDSPASQLAKSVAQLRTLKDLPVVPVGIACEHPFGAGTWRPTVAQLDNFHAAADALDLPGECWWAWEHAERLPEFWGAIARQHWSRP
jgi:hypothetical protein